MADDDDVRVVVVDDVPDVADTLAMQLTLDGYTVTTAYSAAEAIRAIERQMPHCVLLDIGMPGIDGHELAALLRRRYQDDVVLIAVTGSDETQASVAGTYALVDHHFRKPLDTKALRKLLPTLRRPGSHA